MSLKTAGHAALLIVLAAASACLAVEMDLRPNRANVISFDPVDARYVRVVIAGTSGGQPCLDEFEIYGPTGDDNLAHVMLGGMATASSCLQVSRTRKPSLDSLDDVLGGEDDDLDLDVLGGKPGKNKFHQIANLNDGKYGNASSWVAASEAGEWAEIELPQPLKIAKVVLSRDRGGKLTDRMPTAFDIRISMDAKQWKTVAAARAKGKPIRAAKSAPVLAGGVIPNPATVPLIDPSDEAALLRHAFACEAASWWKLSRRDPIDRVLAQMTAMLDRIEKKSLDVSAERARLKEIKARRTESKGDPEALQDVWLVARTAKRRLMLRDPDLAPLRKMLVVKRHPLLPSHNYSDMYDSRFTGGGNVSVIEIPKKDGRLDPAGCRTTVLFDGSNGIPRDAVLDYDAETVYFAHRPAGAVGSVYWNLMSVKADGSECRQITGGPFHDYYPCVLPDGGLIFVTTRCKARFLCWKPQTMVLFRSDADGKNMRALSFANLSEWGPSIMRDGRILWTRSEYQDKGADYGHTLWAMRPDGSHPELMFGNNTTYNFMNGREVPGTREICATIISHFGDFNGPIALIKREHGVFNQTGPKVLTPDHRAISNGGRFRDPYPISSDYILVSHNPSQRWAAYVIDRYGNREVIHMDGKFGTMCPTPFRARRRPPVLADAKVPTEKPTGTFVVVDIYAGLGPSVKRGTVKYIRVCEELRSDLEVREDGKLREIYQDFMNHYAAPMEAAGPSGWPTYVAKGVHGLAPVNEDGSAYFEAPAGKVLYFQALDEDLNEIQRMRSVVQLHPGEVRSCVGCHEDRLTAPPQKRPKIGAEPAVLEPPPWGAGAFSYQKVVQPVLDKNCVSCHDATHRKRINLTGMAVNSGKSRNVPVSYHTLVKGGWVNHFHCGWHERHFKANPLTFGTLKSRLWTALAEKHKDVKLTRNEMHAIKCWTDLNCPLWTDYAHRSQRAELACATCPIPSTPGRKPAAARGKPAKPPKPGADIGTSTDEEGDLLDDLGLD